MNRNPFKRGQQTTAASTKRNNEENDDDDHDGGGNIKTGRKAATSEWTVHAQLTISHPGDDASDLPLAATASGDPATKPITVVYQWTTEDDLNQNTASLRQQGGIQQGNVVFTKKTQLVTHFM